MHSGYEIPGIHHQQPPENSCSPLLLSMNPTHILDQIHGALPTTQQIVLDHHHHHHHHHLLPPNHHQTRPNHHYPGGGASSAYFPLNFKLGLNEICSRNDFKDGAAVNGGADALLRGSEHYQLPEARQSSLGMLHSPFWEPLPAEVSNENSEIIDRHELRQRETLTTCLDAKNRVHFSELEAIYKRLGNAESIQTPPNQLPSQLQPVTTPASDPSIGEEPSRSFRAAKKTKTKKKKKTTATTTKNHTCGDNQLVSPMAEFFENLVKQVVDHQENLQKKFTEVMDRLNEERRAREEAWRNQELAHFEREAAARAHEKAMAKNREAIIVSYLEKITGQRINLPPLTTSANTSHDSNCGGDDESERHRNRD